MRRIGRWEVDVEAETLSYHRYIRLEIEQGGKLFPRWNSRNINREWFATSVTYENWLTQWRMGKIIEEGDMDKAERVIKRILTDAYDNSMKKGAGGNERKRKTYWWNAEIANNRKRCNMWRRRLVRAKARKDLDSVEQLTGELKTSRKELRRSIGITKTEAWDELLEGLNKNPWGKPYKIVMNKIKLENMNICEKLPKDTLEEILKVLFPEERKLTSGRS